MSTNNPPQKVCRSCGFLKNIDMYPPDARQKSDGKQARCRECINEWMKTHYRKNVVWAMLRRARARAKKEGFEFNITTDDITPLPIVCPVLGVILRVSEIPQDPCAYSLDRVDNNKGYVQGNVAVISYRANRLKNDGTADDHEAIAYWMRNKAANDNAPR